MGTYGQSMLLRVRLLRWAGWLLLGLWLLACVAGGAIALFARPWLSAQPSELVRLIALGLGGAWLVPIGLLLLASRVARGLREDLRARGFALCFHCGYELSASDSIGVCPECGKPFAQDLTRRQWARTSLGEPLSPDQARNSFRRGPTGPEPPSDLLGTAPPQSRPRAPSAKPPRR